jgi:exosortase J
MQSLHEPLLCHSTRGEDPLWQGQLTAVTANAARVDFSSAFYVDGVSQFLEASTQCAGSTCGEFATERTHFGFIYTRPNRTAVLEGGANRVPVLIRAETMDVNMPADTARQMLAQEVRTFLASVTLDELTRPFTR